MLKFLIKIEINEVSNILYVNWFRFDYFIDRNNKIIWLLGSKCTLYTSTSPVGLMYFVGLLKEIINFKEI